MKRFKLMCAALALAASAVAQNSNYVSEVWVADRGDGTYRNPVLYADYSDPDACRVGDDFYMTSSSFNCLPGLQILHSKDLVNWTIIGAAVPNYLPPVETPERPEHGNRVWAPSIRFHNGEFYIFWGDPDFGAYMVKAKDPKGPWTEPVLVKPGKGIIDTCPLWDDDGKVYMVHAFAGSRAGLKSVIAVCELNEEASKAITPSRIIFDGHEEHQTCEGPKFYKRGEYYYIFHPAGGVPTGWQVVQRSKNVYGPYEWKTVMAQGKSSVNGPHQGAWVDTPTGEDWFLHFQDVGAYGRLVHLSSVRIRMATAVATLSLHTRNLMSVRHILYVLRRRAMSSVAIRSLRSGSGTPTSMRSGPTLPATRATCDSIPILSFPTIRISGTWQTCFSRRLRRTTSLLRLS
jgi:beta-xylosidase